MKKIIFGLLMIGGSTNCYAAGQLCAHVESISNSMHRVSGAISTSVKFKNDGSLAASGSSETSISLDTDVQITLGIEALKNSRELCFEDFESGFVRVITLK